MTAHPPRLNVVLSPFQNAFFAELAEVVVAELEHLQVECRLVTEPADVVPTFLGSRTYKGVVRKLWNV